MSAEDEIRQEDHAWKRAGEVVGLIASRVETTYEFAVPEAVAEDRRNCTADQPRASGRRAARPAWRSAAEANQELDSLLDLAEEATPEDLASVVLHGSGGGLFPQRGVDPSRRGAAGATKKEVPERREGTPVRV